VRDAVVSVLRVTPVVAIEPISHVQELLGDYHLERPGLRPINARQVDQDEMISGSGCKRIGTADRAPQSATEPAFKDAALGGDAKPVCWQFEERDVSLQKMARLFVVDHPIHDDLQSAG